VRESTHELFTTPELPSRQDLLSRMCRFLAHASTCSHEQDLGWFALTPHCIGQCSPPHPRLFAADTSDCIFTIRSKIFGR
jgi:hypothetical protein